MESSRGEKVEIRFPDRYENPQLFAFGGSSWVFRAFDTELRRKVVLKVLFANDQQSAKNEVRRVLMVASKVGPHSAVAVPIGVNVSDCGHHFLVFDDIAEGSLHDAILESGALSRDAVLHLGVRLGGVLAWFHQAGYVHGDVTPANVLMRMGTEPVLTDLASAGVIGGEPLRATTRSYTAPETVGLASPQPPLDVYALAQTLLVAYQGFAGEQSEVTNNPDVPSQTAMAVPLGARQAKVIQGDDALMHLLGLGVRPNPADRPTIGAMVEELQSLQREGDLDVTPAEAPPLVVAKSNTVRRPKLQTNANILAVLGLTLCASLCVAGVVIVGLRLTNFDNVSSDDQAEFSTGQCQRLAEVMDSLWALVPAIELQAAGIVSGDPFDADRFVDDTSRFSAALAIEARTLPPYESDQLLDAPAQFQSYLTGAFIGFPTDEGVRFASTMSMIGSNADTCAGRSDQSWSRFDARMAKIFG